MKRKGLEVFAHFILIVFMCAIVILMMLITLTTFLENRSYNYEVKAELGADGLFEDSTGNLWDVDTELKEGDIVVMTINDNGTPTDLTDDIVLQIKRE